MINATINIDDKNNLDLDIKADEATKDDFRFLAKNYCIILCKILTKALERGFDEQEYLIELEDLVSGPMKDYLERAGKWKAVNAEIEQRKKEIELTNPKCLIHPARAFADFRVLKQG